MSIPNMNHSSFHAITFALKPNQPSKPSTFWVAVLYAHLEPSPNLKENDFLWIKCHGGIRVGVILDQYRAKNKIYGNVKLKLGNRLLDNESTMRELNEFNDQLLAFEAVKESELSSILSNDRPPLQPTNRQVKIESAGDSPVPPVKREAGSHESATTITKKSAMPGSALSTQIFGRPAWATSNGFAFYDNAVRSKLIESRPHLTDAEVQDILFDRWLKFSSGERQQYEEIAKKKSRISEVKLEPIKTELMVKNEDLDSENFLNSTGPGYQKQHNFQLQELLKDASPEALESSVEQGVKLLERLKTPMVSKIDDTPDAKQWIDQIDNLSKQVVKTRTVIGVVGNTGAGKSSVINAMLDEERLLPTSCMRACTAVVTEISYNDAEKPYRAQIEFIQRSDWEKELKTLFQDLIDSNGNVSRECTNPDTDAGIAYAKIKAVYPKKTKDDIANSSAEKMLLEVSHVLGTSRNIEETDSLRFYQKLQAFIDSKEKTTGDKEKDRRKEPKAMEFWPLIRVVKIYVKSPALQTGAVIVDLPGVHDSNAARAAVAENYMKECTGLWIVAPITRAVDDKAAKTLLGESFKRQLKMDGGFSSVTFICSKTDDISLTEAQESLGLEKELCESWLKMDEYEKQVKELETELMELKDAKAVFGDIINDTDEQIEVWESLRDSAEDGKLVYAPPKQSKSKKRKSSNHPGPRKKQRLQSVGDGETDDEDYEVTSESEKESDEHVSEQSEVQEPLTEAQVNAKISELRGLKKNARNQRTELNDKATVFRKQIEEARQSVKKINAEISFLCISGRNQYSKGAIQQDFASGMKEMDEEMAEQADEQNFNPDIELRDYEQVARELPVFCVSSRGYQKLQGRLQKDPNVPGFKTIEETEIPQLQAHCGKLTKKGRIANCKRFINNLSLLLNSLALWASNDGTNTNMTADQVAREDRVLEKGLKKLESGFGELTVATCKELLEELGDNIFVKYDSAIQNATNEASTIARQWGAPVNRDNRSAGGYHWSTYKAICRRNGVYSNGQGPHEWNMQLCEPMMKLLASGWEKTFTRRLPTVLLGFTQNATSQLKDFHENAESRARKIGAGIAGLHMLQPQLGVYENIFKDLANLIKETVNNVQKEINREFTPVIERLMSAAYTECVDESGPGSYSRMKVAMTDHVDQERHVMFQQSANQARGRLEKMVKDQENTLSDKIDQVFVAVCRDYRSVLGGGNIHGDLLPKPQILLKSDVITVLEGVEEMFQEALGDGSRDSKDDDQLSQEPSLNNPNPNPKSEDAGAAMKSSQCEPTESVKTSRSDTKDAEHEVGGPMVSAGSKRKYGEAELSSDEDEAEQHGSLSDEVYL